VRVILPVRVDPVGWMGGANYYRSLVAALRGRMAEGDELIVASNQPEAFGSLDGAGIRLAAAPWLEPSSSVWSWANAALTSLTHANVALNAFARSTGADLVSHSVPGRLAPCPSLHWMPDFQHRHFPEFFSTRERGTRDRNIRQAGRSGHLLVSSASAGSDFRRFYPEFAGAHVHVLRFVPAIETAPGQPGGGIPAKFGLPPWFFLLPNQFWRHKNHALVLEALRQLPDDFVVAATGALNDYRGGAHIAALRDTIERHRLGDRFRMLGVLPREEMLELMRSAQAVINPSLFEGWSSTVEEAKALGKRLLLSDIGVHREQDPLDALYFDPGDAAALAQAMLLARHVFDPAADALRMAAAKAAYPGKVARFAAEYMDIARVVARQA
jgi:glycosyltransferase involved in cell wall biosynthesis